MSDQGSIIPISDEQAKALQEALKTLRGLGSFLEQALGSAPEDLVGLLGGDWLKVRRAENMTRMMQKAKEKLEARRIKDPEPANLATVLPILRAAADESREELQDLWARLFAAAMDPARKGLVRAGFVETVGQMDPIDVLVLEKLSEGTNYSPNARDFLASMFRLTSDEIELSIRHLERLECVINTGGPNYALSAKGRVLMQAIRD